MNTVDLDKLNYRPGCLILDIGCGNGRHLGEAIQKTGITIIGVDRNQKDLIQARKRLADIEQLGLGTGSWGVNVADMMRLPFRDHTFDGVICSEVLEHVEEEMPALAEINRILKPGRCLAISVPRFFPEWICWKLSHEYRNTGHGHIRIYSKKRLKTMANASGYTVYSSHYAHSLHSPFWWLKCLIGPSRKDNRLVNLYQQLLMWDIMEKPLVTRWAGKLLDPLLGKSIVLYLRKQRLDSLES